MDNTPTIPYLLLVMNIVNEVIGKDRKRTIPTNS